MISANELQNSYVQLYKQVREYIWPLSTVEHLADLEVSIYSRFPDMEDIRKQFKLLKSCMIDEIREDEELKSALDNFNKLIEDANTFYSSLNQVREVV